MPMADFSSLFALYRRSHGFRSPNARHSPALPFRVDRTWASGKGVGLAILKFVGDIPSRDKQLRQLCLYLYQAGSVVRAYARALLFVPDRNSKSSWKCRKASTSVDKRTREDACSKPGAPRYRTLARCLVDGESSLSLYRESRRL